MLTVLPPFFDHSRHKLVVHRHPFSLDVLAFEGEEQVSQPFLYRVEFTSVEQDIGADRVLGKAAQFSLHAAAHTLPVAIPGLRVPSVEPSRTLHGVITGFKRLSGSADEARYEVTLEPRLALLGRGRQFRIYQHQSVPEIVESILRSRHDFEGQDFLFTLVREYPKREQVMQYGESDLAFISRLLAEVGIWYRFTNDERLGIAVVEFYDDQRHYVRARVSLPFRPQWVRAEMVRPERVYCRGSKEWIDGYRFSIALGMAPGGVVKVWVGGSCLGFKEVGRYQAKVEPLGPYRGASKGKYIPLESGNKAYVDQHGIPYGSW